MDGAQAIPAMTLVLEQSNKACNKCNEPSAMGGGGTRFGQLTAIPIPPAPELPRPWCCLILKEGTSINVPGPRREESLAVYEGQVKVIG